MAELKKCPFCGGEAEIEREWVDGFYQKYYSCVHVVCQKCYATIGRTYDDKDRSKAYAIKAWNNRATESEIRAKVLNEVIEQCNEEKWQYMNDEDTWQLGVLHGLTIAMQVAEQLKEE